VDADTVTAIAAVVAALASLGALGTSIYGVRYTAKHTAELERTRWSRERLADELALCMDLAADWEAELVRVESADFGKPNMNIHAALAQHLSQLAARGSSTLAAAADSLRLDAQYMPVRMLTAGGLEGRAEALMGWQASVAAFQRAARAEIGLN